MHICIITFVQISASINAIHVLLRIVRDYYILAGKKQGQNKPVWLEWNSIQVTLLFLENVARWIRFSMANHFVIFIIVCIRGLHM